MKTLYITDLDGTFLNSEAEITPCSAEIIRKLISEGGYFSVATARTKATVLDMFKSVGLNTPIALMNGVMVFDTKNNKTVSSHAISKETAYEILAVYKKYNKHPMLYMDRGSYLEIIYTKTDNIHHEYYISNRKNKKLKKFIKADEYDIGADDKLIYIVSLDKPDELEPIYKEISKLDGVVSSFYSDNYTSCNFLETMNSEINKGTAAIEIKKLLGVDRIIAFGDNLNDIPLFEVADEAYAVSDAHESLKAAATGVIGSNDEDGVAHFIYQHFKEQR